MQDDEKWPGKVEDYRNLRQMQEDVLNSDRYGDLTTAERLEIAATFANAAQTAGVAQLLDKLVYTARYGKDGGR